VASQVIQSICQVSEEGRHFMKYYDVLHPHVRARLRDSRFNLCVACLTERVGLGNSNEHDWFRAIQQFEWEIEQWNSSRPPAVTSSFSSAL
jgi:hypothetical protein